MPQAPTWTSRPAPGEGRSPTIDSHPRRTREGEINLPGCDGKVPDAVILRAVKHVHG
jgi:hypothetical protein